MRTIEIVVQLDGQVKIEAVGFQGPDCEKATAFLEKALGTVTSKAKKPEYHQRARQKQTVGR